MKTPLQHSGSPDGSPRKVARRLSRPQERRAVFFDRDGTLNEEVGYVNHVDRFRLFPFAANAIRRVNEAGMLAIVITNQTGIARGLFPESLVEAIHKKLMTKITAGGAKLDAIYFCPHHPEAAVQKYRLACDCRKPAPGLLGVAAKRFHIDLEQSFVVGDRYADVQLAHRVGARGILVLTGYGRGEWEYRRGHWERPPDYVARNASDAVRWILRKS